MVDNKTKSNSKVQPKKRILTAEGWKRKNLAKKQRKGVAEKIEDSVEK